MTDHNHDLLEANDPAADASDITVPRPAELDHFRELLATHRRTLQHYLSQEAALGKSHVPPGIASGIHDARLAIAELKATLRGWRIPVVDLPGETLPEPAGSPPVSRRLFRKERLWLYLGVVIAIALFGAGAIFFRPEQPAAQGATGPATTTATIVIDPVDPGTYMVLVADIEPATNGTDPIAEDLSNIFETNLPQSRLRIRSYPRAITSNNEARQLAEAHHAAVIVWGSYSELNIQIGALDLFPDNRIDRGTLERTANIQVKLDPTADQSIAPYVLNILQALQTADGDGYSINHNANLLDLIQPSTPEILGGNNTIAKYFHRGLIYHFAKSDQAIEQYTLALRQDTGNPLFYILRATALLRNGKFADAEQDARTAQNLEKSGQWATPIWLQGASAIYLKQYDTAFDRFDTVIKLRPKDWFPRYLRGFLHYLNGHLAESEVDIKESIALGTDTSLPYQTLVMLQLRQGALNEARQTIRLLQEKFVDPVAGDRFVKALFGEHENVWSPTIQAFNNLLLDRDGDVVTYADEGLKYDDRFIDLYFIRGFAQCKTSNNALAEASYTEGLAIDPDFTLLHLLRAEVRHKQGDTAGYAEDITMVEQSAQAALLGPYLKAIALDPPLFSCVTFLARP